MSILQIPRGRPDPADIGRIVISKPSFGSGSISKLISESLQRLNTPTPTFSSPAPERPKGIEESLYDSLASFKIRTASVAMHIDREWRSGLFRQLDSLLAAEDWEADDLPPTLASFSTFLRMLALCKPDRRPGLGASHDGNLIATWSSNGDHLTIECLAKDMVRWSLTVAIDGERERAAAVTPLLRLATVLHPYSPDRWWAMKDAE